MKLQKNLSMQREGQLEFDAPGHKGAPHHLSKNRNPGSSRIGKKRPIKQKHIPGDVTTVQLKNDTLAFLKECEGIEAQRRGTSWIKHDNFIRFVCGLYKKAQGREECRTVIYLASKEEQ
jgi:hypothetical protein